MNEQDTTLMKRLNQHPSLRQRMEALLAIVENTKGSCDKANDAEEYVINELRKMGNDALSCWADNAVERSVEVLHQEVSGLQGKGKKSPLE